MLSCRTFRNKGRGYIKSNTGKKRDLSEFGKYLGSLPHIYETKEPENIPAGAEKIGVDEHKSLEFIPGRLFVRVTLIPKYKVAAANNNDDVKIIAAAAPSRPLRKCIAGATTLAQLLVDKFAESPASEQAESTFFQGRNRPPVQHSVGLGWQSDRSHTNFI